MNARSRHSFETGISVSDMNLSPLFFFQNSGGVLTDAWWIAADGGGALRKFDRGLHRAPFAFAGMLAQLEEPDSVQVGIGQHILQRVRAHNGNVVLHA